MKASFAPRLLICFELQRLPFSHVRSCDPNGLERKLLLTVCGSPDYVRSLTLLFRDFTSVIIRLYMYASITVIDALVSTSIVTKGPVTLRQDWRRRLR